MLHRQFIFDVSGSLIDIILTNKPSFFQKKHKFVRSIFDFHKLVVTVLRSYYKKLPPKNILYRNVKRFEKTPSRLGQKADSA